MIYQYILKLQQEYEKVLKRYYDLGGTVDFLERSGIKKTFVSDRE